MLGRGIVIVLLGSSVSQASAQLVELDHLRTSPPFDGACPAVDGRAVLSRDLFPIGFSPDGHFAFVSAGEEMVGYTESVRILNLVN